MQLASADPERDAPLMTMQALIPTLFEQLASHALELGCKKSLNTHVIAVINTTIQAYIQTLFHRVGFLYT